MKPFKTEAEMCARFIKALPLEWIAYPETADWDILLVRKEDGFQIGIQAKLRLNAEVINQSLDEYASHFSHREEGPDCRAVMVPEGVSGLGRICDYIGLTVIRVDGERPPNVYGSVFSPSLPKLDKKYQSLLGEGWHEWCPLRRHKLPDYIPDVVAGSPSPIRLTDWKIRAIKIAIILEKRGYVTRADFKSLRIDDRRWMSAQSRWLLPSASGRFIAGRALPNFKDQHPIVYAQIAADFEEWSPKISGAPEQFQLLQQETA